MFGVDGQHGSVRAGEIGVGRRWAVEGGGSGQARFAGCEQAPGQAAAETEPDRGQLGLWQPAGRLIEAARRSGMNRCCGARDKVAVALVVSPSAAVPPSSDSRSGARLAYPSRASRDATEPDVVGQPRFSWTMRVGCAPLYPGRRGQAGEAQRAENDTKVPRLTTCTSSRWTGRRRKPWDEVIATCVPMRMAVYFLHLLIQNREKRERPWRR